MAEEDIKKIIEDVNKKTTIKEPVPPVEDPNKPGFDMEGNKIVEKDDNDDDASTKRDAAFAKMRIEARTKDNRIAELQAKIDELTAKKEEEDKADPKADDKDDKVDPKIAALEAKIDALTRTQTEKEQAIHIENIRMNLDSLKTKYNLSDNDMMDFAEQAEMAGYRLGANPKMIENIYQTLNVDKIIALEVEKVKKELAANGNRTPGTGPKRQGTNNSGKSPAEILAAIEARTK